MKRLLTLTTAGIGCAFLAGCPDDRAMPPPEQRMNERPLTEDARLDEQWPAPADQEPVPGQTTPPVPEPRTPAQPERELEDAIRRPDRDQPEN